MLIGEKITALRKKNGWSQEELADKMNVSRQAVSKWESDQTIPDLDKVLILSKLFNVTTDYLLKDEIENQDFVTVSNHLLVNLWFGERKHLYVSLLECFFVLSQ